MLLYPFLRKFLNNYMLSFETEKLFPLYAYRGLWVAQVQFPFFPMTEFGSVYTFNQSKYSISLLVLRCESCYTFPISWLLWHPSPKRRKSLIKFPLAPKKQKHLLLQPWAVRWLCSTVGRCSSTTWGVSNMALGVDASPLAAMHRDSLGSSVHFAITILSQHMRLPGGGKAWGTEVSQALILHSPPAFKNAANIFWLHSYSMLFSSFLPAKYSLGCLKKLTCLSIFKAQGTVQEI